MRANLRSATTSVALALLATVSCSTPKQSGTAGDTAQRAAGSGTANDTISALARVAQLESEARGLAKTSGCSSDSQCRTAPVGEKACGGPRIYIPYCAASTDSVALFKKLGDLSAAEKAYNKSAGTISTCEFRLPPAVAVKGGICRPNTSP